MSNVSSPTESDSVEVNDQLATTSSNLSALLRKQKFYMNMIDSLEPASDLNPKEAKVQSEHLNQFYEKFISNQSEITTLVEDASFGDQVEISQKVEQKVRKIQTKLEEIISAIITVIQSSASSVINEHFNQTERPRVITELLDSQLKTRKSLLEQIECIESKSRKDVDAAEAERKFELHDAFVKNQSDIKAYINSLALDEQLQISGGILREVIALQIQQKKIVAPVSCVEAQAKSSVTVWLLPEGVSADDVPSYAFLSGKFGMLFYGEICIYQKILHNIDHPPNVAGRIRLHPLVDNVYRQFLKLRKAAEEDFCEFPYFLRKVTELSKRVERAVEDYGLYCDGKIPRRNLDYISSIVNSPETLF